MAPQPRNDTTLGQLWYRGHFNLKAQLDHMIANHGLAGYSEVGSGPHA